MNIIRKYIALRPNHVKESRLFLRYRDGKCTIQPIGKNKFAKMPRRIAKYLKLPEPERYSGTNDLPSTQTEMKEIISQFIF